MMEPWASRAQRCPTASEGFQRPRDNGLVGEITAESSTFHGKIWLVVAPPL